MKLSLLESLEDLARLARRFPAQAASAGGLMAEARLAKLSTVVAEMGQPKPARRVNCPEEYLRHWREVLGGRREDLEPRAVRYLCWEPSAAQDERFQAYLDARGVELGSKALQGLVRSCHAVWSEGFAAGPVAAAVRRRLEAYKGPGRLVAKWKESPSTVVGARGPAEFAARIVGGRLPPGPACETWGFDAHSPYAAESVRAAASLALKGASRDTDLREYLIAGLISWDAWPAADFKRVIGQVILDPVSEVAEFRERLKALVLGDVRLGDPRLPANNTKWYGVDDAARRRFVQWLSQADIVFFFEHVMTRDQDWHGRKEFWLKYVGSLQQSRPLLNQTDQARLKWVLSRGGAHSVHFGQTGGYSAFLLDFGPVLVVEFSGVGAIYVYQKDVVKKVTPDFYTTKPFTDWDLKQRSICSHRQVHGRYWQYDMTNVLARYGVRPG